MLAPGKYAFYGDILVKGKTKLLYEAIKSTIHPFELYCVGELVVLSKLGEGKENLIVELESFCENLTNNTKTMTAKRYMRLSDIKALNPLALNKVRLSPLLHHHS